MEQEQRYRVWFWVEFNEPMPRMTFNIPVDSIEEGKKIIDRMANDQLKDDRIGSNVFGVQELIDKEHNEWEDVEDDEWDR